MGAHNGVLAAEMRGSRPAGELSGFNECLFGDGAQDDSDAAIDRQPAFANQRSAALALLTSDARLTRQAGSFLGQLAVDPTPLSEKQSAWLATLLDRAGLPPVSDGEA